eukprot:CAMPEP_0197443846 /NCGR_PEP_ID=MMETSP1175-20131217/9482_1 /TAXON_ID=1003142 /ORGANISM="Triceratium dubium, Strain CCMP147" /LENGTH=1531 /DNA_ID=CAMNT_0042974537 /DNA_START=443 /DNA_END=5038 /DNA_ORIENTATION=+
MALSVSRAKTAFQFFQAERIGDIKKELGPGTSMGTAMSELSERWRNLSENGRSRYVAKEAEDRKRFQRESAAADARAYAEQTARRNNLVAKEGEVPSERGARKRVADERAELDAARRRRKAEIEAEMDPEELAERRRIKAQKKAETAERQRKREEQERAVAERHKKLDKAESQRANSRLEFLLKQSAIFSKLKMGGHHKEDEEKKEDGKYVSHHRQAGSGKGRPPRKASSKSGEEIDEDEEGNEDSEQHVFLTKQPSCIKFGTLKPYQLESLNWMIHLAEKGLNGILADEMGLGKTLQSISILAYNYEYLGIQGPHLICVPKSTLSNWMNELNRWCPSLRAIRFHGSKEDREAIIREYFTNEAASHDGKRPPNQIRNEDTGDMEDDNSENPRAWDVCVTTYEVCNTERKTLEKFGWRYLVIDEAHRLKNEASMFSKTVRGFKTAYRLLLTGTPLQNNLHELWALLNFLLPDIFSSAEQFDEWFNLEIDDAEAKKGMISQLHNILRPFMIRRLKVDVAKGLPPKTETLIMVGMSRMQKALYKKLLLRDIESIAGKTTSKNRTAVLNIVMQLRKCCGHPYLFEGVEDRSLDPLGEHLVENCGKLAIMDKLLKKLKERGSRVLIFTQMTRILDILEDFMFMRGYKYCRIDGNTDYADREAAIDNFNKEGSEKFCFILSTRAGGLGINLQTADTCILYDSDWNPQADLQAQDRCHRLGQKKPVNVYRLVTENTVEEKIVERAQQKLKLDAMVVQQGRLKEKDKVSKEEIMAAVRFGADTVFRSEESTITDDDIDAILERGKAKTAELAAKIQKADKGDMLDFRLDAGMSAQNFEGVDYSDRDLRNQLRLMAANSMGKRERRPPPTNYNPIIQPKKSMLVNNRKVKLPRVLRLPRMEDHQFYNRERLLELDKLEFETYAALREVGELPPRESIEATGTLLDPSSAAEKLELLDEGFGNWTRSQYFNFVKACAKFGRDDLSSIAAEMEIPLEDVTAYSEAFWKYGPSELKKDEWERAMTNITKGEQKIAKKKKQGALLQKFLLSFDNPRVEMTFANKGTAHFALEQDRALLAAVDKFGYGNWEAVREELRSDVHLQFQHAVQGMNQDMIGKRIDYRMRQMEKEVEAREKKLKSEKPANVVAAEKAIAAIKEMEQWESKARDLELRGDNAPSLGLLSEEARAVMEERLEERQTSISRLREIETQVRGCKKLADETRKSILGGAQYVNYSNITLKAGGPQPGDDNIAGVYDVEKEISAAILQVPECGVCPSCTDDNSRKLCVNRLEKRLEVLADAEAKAKKADCGKKKNGKKRGRDDIDTGAKSAKKDSSSKKKKKYTSSFAKVNPNHKGSIRMAVTDDLLPELCRRIGASGTNKRMKTIEDFSRDFPGASVRQVTFKFADITTRDRPGCIEAKPERTGPGRSFDFYLRPRLYHLLPEDERPKGWQKYAREDEIRYKAELEKKKAKGKATKKTDAIDEGVSKSSGASVASETDSIDNVSVGTSGGGSAEHSDLDDGDETEEEQFEEPVKKKKKSKKKSS